MIDVERYRIFRVVTETERNAWRETLFSEGEIVHCVYDGGNVWLARNIMSPNVTPRMLPKVSTRDLTQRERKEHCEIDPAESGRPQLCECGALDCEVDHGSEPSDDVSRYLPTIELVAPAQSSLADLAYWWGRGNEIWPKHDIIVTTRQLQQKG